MDILEKLDTADHAMTPQELAAFFQVTTNTIYRWAKLGVIPSFNISGEKDGADIRFNPKDVATFVRKRHHIPKNTAGREL